ncbi:MAG: phage holin family protein [Thermoleophilia bacterium]
MDIRQRITSSIADIRNRGQQLVQLNLELLAAELKAKGAQYGSALGMLAAAAVLVFFFVGFTLATIAAALALVVPWWAALLIVAVGLLLVALILALVGRAQIIRAGTPVPERAVAEAQATVAAVRTQVQETATRILPTSHSVAEPVRPADQVAPYQPLWLARPLARGDGQATGAPNASAEAADTASQREVHHDS